MEKMNKAGIMPFLTKCCNIIGIMMIGAMACSMVTLKIPFVYEAHGATINVQEFYQMHYQWVLHCYVFGCYERKMFHQQYLLFY